MKDLIQNARAVEARIRHVYGGNAICAESADTIASLITALEAAQADAARLCGTLDSLRFAYQCHADHPYCQAGVDQDLIDAAIAAQSAQEK